ncbi:MAG: DUF1987 domain-containing protein [Nitrosopumilus sp.]|nr:DUF1987 domain-containing protein [Nitrosopumilus sp.]
MKRLEIAETSNTPHIVLDVNTNTFVIEGKSFPEDSKEFYRPFIDWMEEFKAKSPISINMHFNLFYLSSSSIISVKQFLAKLVEMQSTGTKVTITWSYDDDDDDIRKTGEDYQKLTRLNFEYRIN